MSLTRSARVKIAGAALALAALGAASMAHAGTDVYFSGSVVAPGVSVGLSSAPPVYYPQPVYVEPQPVDTPPAVVYSDPAPVYEQSAPVYEETAPVYYVGRPRYYAPQYVGRGWQRRGEWARRRHWEHERREHEHRWNRD